MKLTKLKNMSQDLYINDLMSISNKMMNDRIILNVLYLAECVNVTHSSYKSEVLGWCEMIDLK